jgi:hypothetical protein
LTIEKSQAARNIIEAVGVTITRGLPPHNLGQLSKIKKKKQWVMVLVLKFIVSGVVKYSAYGFVVQVS